LILIFSSILIITKSNEYFSSLGSKLSLLLEDLTVTTVVEFSTFSLLFLQSVNACKKSALILLGLESPDFEFLVSTI